MDAALDAAPKLSTLGKYSLIASLGQGGMAKVYLALMAGPAGFNKLLVVKELKDDLAHDPDFLSMFLDEARIAARLNHPNVIAVYDVGQDGLSNYIVMEYVEGNDLRELIRDAGSLPPERVVDIGCQIAAALEYAHRAGLVHRDIKSQNVLVTPDGKVKVADFGIAVVRGIALSRVLLRLRHRDLRALLADVWPARNCGPGADRCQSAADGR